MDGILVEDSDGSLEGENKGLNDGKFEEIEEEGKRVLGRREGFAVGIVLGEKEVIILVGLTEGGDEGNLEDFTEGTLDGSSDGHAVGSSVGIKVGYIIGISVGNAVGVTLGF